MWYLIRPPLADSRLPCSMQRPIGSWKSAGRFGRLVTELVAGSGLEQQKFEVAGLVTSRRVSPLASICLGALAVGNCHRDSPLSSRRPFVDHVAIGFSLPDPHSPWLVLRLARSLSAFASTNSVHLASLAADVTVSTSTFWLMLTPNFSFPLKLEGNKKPSRLAPSTIPIFFPKGSN